MASIRHKVFPELNLIVIADTNITSDTHFVDLITAVQSDVLFDEAFHILYDGRAIDWCRSNASDLNYAIDLMHDNRSQPVHCIYLVNNIGQMAYADMLFISSRKYIVEYFSNPHEACTFIEVPVEILDISQY